jgi:asparagine synthase (glutamine-hydrolysing)
VILFNDRYGMHRVYYYEGKDSFLFSSEAKSLLKVRPELRQIDAESLGQLVSCNCVLQNRTLFSNIFLLPGGAAWTWQNRNSVKKNYYFHPSAWEQQSPLEKEIFYPRLKDTFLKILPRYFRAEERIGLSLSGGLDTRMVIAGLNPMPGQFPCYTFGSMRDMLDIRIARKVADACNQTHHTIRLDHRFFSEFPRLAESTIYISDGYLDLCNTHDIYLNRLVKEIAPIRMSGKFGSEIIRNHTMFNGDGGYNRIFHADFRAHVRKSLETLAEMKHGHALSVALFKEFPWREYGKLSMEQSQLTLRTPYMDNDLVEVMYQAPVGIRSSNEVQRRIIAECHATLGTIMTDRGFFSGSYYPFSKLIELFYFSLFKLDYIYLFALPHWLTKLDSIFSSVSGGKQILGYQKFEYYRIWFRNQLSSYIREILLDKQTASRPYFDKHSIEKIVHGHLKGEKNYLNEINRAITVELIHRQLIDA